MTIIRVIDFETTGEKPPAEVCEVGICDVHLPIGDVSDPQAWLCGASEMPPVVRAVHHISLAEVVGEEPFDPDDLHKGEPAYLAAHNAEFERQFFVPRTPMICTYKAALRIWPDAPSHSNGALRYWLEDAGKISPYHPMTQPAHRAGPDAYVTAHILMALIDAGAMVEQMAEWTLEPRLLPRCPIGKFRGQPWSDVETGFLQWMGKQVDMEADLKWNAQRELDRRFG